MNKIATSILAAAVLAVAACQTAQKGGGATAAVPDGTSPQWTEICKTYVKGDYFDYAGLARSASGKQKLNQHMEWQGDADIKAWTREAQIAFYINAYNSCCIKAIVDNYPVHSPMDIEGYFDKLKYKVAGEMLTVSEVEYDRLIANYKDMRAHFAVVCSDRGCLPIRSDAYTGTNLDANLEERAKAFVADERQFKVDTAKKTVEISKIFNWYGEKFTKDPKRPAAKAEQYLKYWASDDVKKLLESGEYTLTFKEWDWTLNEKHGVKAATNSSK